MKAGRIASLVLLIVFVVLAGLIGLLASQLAARGMEWSTSPAVIAGALGLIFGLILFPLGWSLDRAVTRLEGSMERLSHVEASSTEGAEAANPLPALLPPPTSNRWLLPISHAFTAVADRFRQREQHLRNLLREQEIRRRVSEAERRQVEHVLHALRDPVIVTDAFDDIVMCNRAAADALGFELEKAIHQPIEQVLAQARRTKAQAPGTPEPLRLTPSSCTPGQQRLCKLIRDAREAANFADGRQVELEIETDELPRTGEKAPTTVYDVTLACVENHKAEVGGVVTILRDLSRERELSQLKTDFVSKASHELRTPLSSIRAYVEMLVDGEASDEHARQEFYRIIHDETERLGRLIDNMLNISRIEAGIVQIERENVDMREVIQKALHTLEPAAAEKGIALSAKLANVNLCVEGDSDMLYQVVLNLLSNAIKYTPAAHQSEEGPGPVKALPASHGSLTGGGGGSSRVTVSADSDNLTRSVVVTVADTGLGIPPDALPKLFDKFYRVENYKRVAKGTGLGLSLCKHIVETVHRGQIGVESKLGLGSRFWFSVPMQYAGSKAAA